MEGADRLRRFFPGIDFVPIRHYELVLPELGMGANPVLASMWLVEVGDEVTEGDRLLEVVAGAATVDLPCPATGTLAEVLVAEDDLLVVGQLLAIIDGEPSDESS